MLKGALRLFTGGLLGKGLGFIREALLAGLFGASDVVAASRIAQASVLAPMNLLTTDALSGSFLPLEAQLIRDNPRAAYVLYRGVQISFVVVGVLTIPLALLGGNAWVSFIAPGLPTDVLTMSFAFMAIMTLGVPSYLHYNMLAYLDMAHQGFRLSSVRATGQSLGLIAGVLAAYFLNLPVLIAAGFTAAYLAMSVWGMWYVRRRGYLPSERGAEIGETWMVVKPFLTKLRWLIWLPILSQTTLITEKIVSSHLGAAAVASIDYARLITDTGVLLLATPIGLASLPAFALVNQEEVRAKLGRTLEPLIIIGLASSSILAAFSLPIVMLLFMRGAFDRESAVVTASILAGLAVGMWAQLAVYFTLKVLNSRALNWAAVLAAALGALTTIAIRPWFADIWGAFGIGAAVSAGFVVSFVTSLIILRALRLLLMHLALATPMVVATFVIARQAWTMSLLPSICVLVLAMLAWVGYLMAIPPTRRQILFVAKGILSRRRPPS